MTHDPDPAKECVKNKAGQFSRPVASHVPAATNLTARIGVPGLSPHC